MWTGNIFGHKRCQDIFRLKLQRPSVFNYGIFVVLRYSLVSWPLLINMLSFGVIIFCQGMYLNLPIIDLQLTKLSRHTNLFSHEEEVKIPLFFVYILITLRFIIAKRMTIFPIIWNVVFYQNSTNRDVSYYFIMCIIYIKTRQVQTNKLGSHTWMANMNSQFI